MSTSIIQQAWSAMMTVLVAKFMLNDAPHTLGLMTNNETKYRMRCKQCGYTYTVSMYGRLYEYERCPICGHGASSTEFLQEVVRA